MSALSFSLLKSKFRRVSNDQRESLSVLTSNSLASNKEIHDFRRGFQNIALDVGAIRDTMIVNQATSSSISSIQKRNFESLPRLQEGVEKLPETFEKLLQKKFEDHWRKTSELLQTLQLSADQRNMPMQDHVSMAIC